MPPRLIHGDSLEVLHSLDSDSVDALVTDPPSGISYMNAAWDTKDVFQIQMRAIFEECLRVLKPGAHGFVWALPRTSHWTATALEDAGFEIRDVVTHVFGSGFPKSHNVSKGIDKAAGMLEDEGHNTRVDGGTGTASYRPTIDPRDYISPEPATSDAKQWEGWGSALKPASEHWILARKPLEKGLSIAQNVLKHGTGAINIDASRIGNDTHTVGGGSEDNMFHGGFDPDYVPKTVSGRFPANFIHDGIDEEWSRYFYCSKSSKSEKNAGLDEFPERGVHRYGSGIGEGHDPSAPAMDCNVHPTVKPTKLMRYLITMICAPGGLVLDPFAGSCTTGVAAIETKRDFIGIEREHEYHAIGVARMSEARGENDPQNRLFA